MEIQQQKVGAVTVVRPRGAATEPDADTLKATLLETRSKNLGRVVLDMSSVAFVDGRALEALLDVTEELGKTGHALKLSNANEVVREVLEITDLASHFELYDDVQSAVRSFL